MWQRTTAAVVLTVTAGAAMGAISAPAPLEFGVVEFAISSAPYIGGGVAVDSVGKVWGFSAVTNPTSGFMQRRLFSYTPQTGVVNAPLVVTDVDPLGLSVNPSGQMALDVHRYTGDLGRRFYRHQVGQTTWTNVTPGVRSGVADINVAGNAVGWMDSPTTFQSTAALFRSGLPVTYLGTLGGPTSFATGVSDAGMVVGTSTTGQSNGQGPISKAFRWTSTGGMVNLGTLGGANSHASDVNEAGVIVGTAQNSQGKNQAFVYTPTTGMRILGTVPGQFWGGAFRVNELGWVLGELHTNNDVVSFIWSETTGLINLSALLAPWTSYDISGVLDMNDFGQIAAVVETPQGSRIARLTVALIPAPGGAAALGLALVFASRRRR